MRKVLVVLSCMLIFLCTRAAEVSVHCANDAARIREIVSRLRDSDASLGDRLIMAADEFTGLPEDDYYLTDSVALLRLNVDSFSPLMFVNNVIALVKTANQPGPADENTFFSQFENIACRRGENLGFPSIMYHTADWIGDNVARGNITELTENYSGMVDRNKSLDEMTRKRGNYAALADSATFETVRMTEMGFRTHRIPTLKKETIKKKEVVDDLQNGDIIILVPNRDGIDCYDIGFVELDNGVPHLVHVSPQTKTVVREKEDLARYMQLVTKNFQGYRILRVRD